jgi:alpha-methylacyl-CoA racemase
MTSMPLPLEGITVLDFSTLLPGPLATLMLAEAGARVIKIERPDGEDMRRFPPDHGGASAPFAVLNAGKSSLALDLKTEKARSQLHPLIERADILVEQFRPGVMERLGLGYDAVHAINPRLIYCSISGYGQTGPRAAEAGHDINYQATTGLLSLAPAMPAALVADIAGGAMPAVMNILLALRQRDLTGQGMRIDIAMADAMFTFAWFALAEGHATGRMPGPWQNMLAGGSPRYGLYPTADRRFVALGALEEKFWANFCNLIGLDEPLRDDAREPEATRNAIRTAVGSATADIWRHRLASVDCCATVVESLADAVTDPHFRGRGLFDFMAGRPGSEIPIAVLPLDPSLRRGPDAVRRVPNAGECDVPSLPVGASAKGT